MVNQDIVDGLELVLTPREMEEARAVSAGSRELDLDTPLYERIYAFYLENTPERAPYATWRMKHESGPDIDEYIVDWLGQDL